MVSALPRKKQHPGSKQCEHRTQLAPAPDAQQLHVLLSCGTRDEQKYVRTWMHIFNSGLCPAGCKNYFSTPNGSRTGFFEKNSFQTEPNKYGCISLIVVGCPAGCKNSFSSPEASRTGFFEKISYQTGPDKYGCISFCLLYTSPSPRDS